MIFKIGNENFTRCVVADSYAVNKADAYSSWVDANGSTHRNISRQRVLGSLNLYMRNAEYQDKFIQALADLKASDGSYPLTLTINNTGADITINAFIDYELTKKTVGIRDTFEQFTVNIEER